MESEEASHVNATYAETRRDALCLHVPSSTRTTKLSATLAFRKKAHHTTPPITHQKIIANTTNIKVIIHPRFLRSLH